jgi:hypothetical protein
MAFLHRQWFKAFICTATLDNQLALVMMTYIKESTKSEVQSTVKMEAAGSSETIGL